MALVHVLVVQNRLLRGETPEVRVRPDRKRVFNVTGGLRSGPIECSWDAGTADIRCGPVVGGGGDQFELVIEEEAAAELVATLAERIAWNGTTTARQQAIEHQW